MNIMRQMKFHFNFKLHVCVWLLSLVLSLALGELVTDARFALKLKGDGKEEVFQGLQQHNFTRLFEITPSTYIFGYTGDRTNEVQSILKTLLHLYGGKIVGAEPVRGYADILKPAKYNYVRDGNTRLLLNSRRFIIKVRKHHRTVIFRALTNYRYFWLYEITTETSVFEYKGHLRDLELELLTFRIQRQYRHQMSIEEVIVYENTIKPEAVLRSYISVPQRFQLQPSQEIDNYFGMGVSKAHELGYTGRGVVVAITDVGIDTGLLDLRENIDQGLCYNFINNSKDVTPEYFHHLQDTSVSSTAHGDHCASIIGSVFGNGVCTFGISFKAKIVGLKIFIVTLYNDLLFNLEPTYGTRSDIIARALVHNLSDIDIFSNSWAPTKPFTALDFATEAAIKYGAKQGRRGLGTIYVVPAGPAGNGFANSIHTIAVNGVGRNWSIPDDSTVSACVITSGLSSGSNITANHMVTTSQRNRCVTTFEGVSAATAEIAAIIALALEANRNLTRRQLKHILVEASEPEGKGNGFSTNAAGHPFHKVFGFGLLNAERLVLLAKNSSVPLPLLKRSLKESSMRESSLFAQETEFCYSCDVNNDVTCLDTVEDVVIKMKLTNYCKQLRLILVSPSGTESILVDYASELNSFFNKKIQLTSVNFWDEVSFGIWRLKLIYPYDSCSGKSSIHTVSLMIYGTKTWKSAQPQTRRGHDICALPKDNVQTTESVTTTREKSRVSITIYIDLPNFVIVVIGLVILGTIIFVIGRLPSQLHYLRKY